MNTFMAYAGGIPTFITLFVFLFALLYLGRKKTISVSKIRGMKDAAKIANQSYYSIKEELKTAKPLTRLRFRLLVGEKRWRDYNYQG